MRPFDVVIAHHDFAAAANLAATLREERPNVAIVENTEQLRSAIARLRAPLAVVDLEIISFQELSVLSQEFSATVFVCIHRLADDAMWSQSLANGAVDCCLAGDLRGILLAAEHYVSAGDQHLTPSAA